jgi:hypothetical protein
MTGTRDTTINTVPELHARRHDPRTVARVRVAVAIWLVVLAGIFCSLGYYWGAALLAPAALHVWLAYRPRASAPGKH